MEEKTYPFVTYLETLRDDRAALAAMRRGLGQPPGTVPDMYPYVVPSLPTDAPPWVESAYYVVAALFAFHPLDGGSGNMGNHFARVKAVVEDDTALERRFTNLLAAHPEDLPFYLRQSISFLKSQEVPVNWHQLFSDIRSWGHPRRFVQKRWARAFWGRKPMPSEQQ